LSCCHYSRHQNKARPAVKGVTGGHDISTTYLVLTFEF
jgi:hypothetical protein